MKNLLILCALLAAGFSAAAQSGLPMPRANMVLVQTPDSAGTALHKLAVVFVAQGYTVDKLDKDFLTLSLVNKTLSGAFSPMLSARASATPGANSIIRITGDFKAVVLGRPLNDVAQFYGAEKGVYVNSFRALERAGRAYPMGTVSFTAQP